MRLMKADVIILIPQGVPFFCCLFDLNVLEYFNHRQLRSTLIRSVLNVMCNGTLPLLYRVRLTSATYGSYSAPGCLISEFRNQVFLSGRVNEQNTEF